MSSRTHVSSNIAGQSPQIAMNRIWWVGLLVLVASSVVSELIRIIAVNLFPTPSDFVSLQWARPIGFSVVGVVGAVLVFALVCRFARHPLRLYHVIALLVLLFSFLPDLALGLHFVPPFLPGFLVHFLFDEYGTPPDIAALAVMHVTTYLITVGLLTTLTRVRSR